MITMKIAQAIVLAMCICIGFADDKAPNPDLGEMWKQPPVSDKPSAPAALRTGDVIARPPTKILEDEAILANVYDGCNRQGELLTEPGVIISTNYPSNYRKNRNCRYNIQAPEGQVVVVLIMDFVVRCGGDYLKIWSPGYSEKKTLCRNSNQPMVDQFYVSNNNRIDLQFKTNRNKQGRGFSLFYFFQDSQEACGNNAAVLTEEAGIIQYPSVFAGDYDNGKNCTWHISAPEDKWIRLSWYQLDIEESSSCEYDRLSVFTGPTLSGQTGLGFCGSEVPEGSLVIATNHAVFNFISDSSVTGAGFTGHYEIIDGVRACGVNQPEVLTALQGTIAVDYAEQYDNNLDCSWNIVVPSGYAIELSVNFFHVEAGSTPGSCDYDGLMIFKNGNTFVDKLCGFLQEGHTIRINSYDLQLSFYSDSSVTEAGFSIDYTAIDPSVMPTTIPPPTTVAPTGSPGGGEHIGLYVDGNTIRHGECGVPVITPSLVQTRIVGGSEATPHSFPWIVSMQDYSHYCAATIIAERWVATAAHCVDGSYPSQINLELGEHHLFQAETPPSITIGVEQIYMHQDYNEYTIENDIALLYTDRPITFTDVVWPACVPTQDFPINQPDCVIAGWGETEGTGNYRKLQQARLPILATSECTQSGWAYDPNELFDSNFCAGYENGGIDTCQGDSGGPLVCLESDNSYALHGIVSWGFGCADYRSPGIYTRVTSYYDWISSTILSHK